MMLYCDQTVTLVRHVRLAEGDVYTSYVLKGVSWFSKNGYNPGNDGEAPKKAFVVRIPAAVLPTELPCPGDLLVRGELLGEIHRLRDVPAEMEAFEIATVGDNRRGHLQHLVVKSV